MVETKKIYKKSDYNNLKKKTNIQEWKGNNV
jgi:hypothetical protein